MLADRSWTPALVASTKLEKGLRANDHEGETENPQGDCGEQQEEAQGVEGKEEVSLMDSIKFPWEYTEKELAEMPEPIGEHGRCIDYRQEAYHDVHVFEDGHEERLYIGD